MASSNAERPPSRPAGEMDAKPMMATGRGDCQRLKDLHRKEETTTTAALLASSKQASAAEPTPAAVMNPLLRASACFGSSKALNFLFNREDAQAPPMTMPTQAFLDLIMKDASDNSIDGSSTMHQACNDVEEGVDQPTSPAASLLLEGVTIEGDTALHVVASHGDGDNFLKCADIVYDRAKHLLLALNKKGDTPLHCAARAGKSEMVSHLIDLARRQDEENSDNSLHRLLRTENERKETALHEAVRTGNNDTVELLLTADSELASFPKEGTSPLYLAILLEKDIIADTLYDKSKGNLSYSGPDGQNALHVAVLRGLVMTEKLLEWNKSLTTQGDKNGSTPLHFASSCSPQARIWRRLHPSLPWIRFPFPSSRVAMKVFEANPAPVCQPDNCGLFPIHVAASVGARWVITIFLKKCPSSAGLRDATGRTFLHVAVEKKKRNIVRYACGNRSLTWILNMQDHDGNTALHLAVQAGSLRMFCALFGNLHVDLNLTNKKGQTPLDIIQHKIPPGLFYNQNSESLIRLALRPVGALNGGCRRDHSEQNYEDIHRIKSDGEGKELENVKDSTQIMCIGTVLIATVAFGATFALPGGYRADDHPNGGTPTLAGSYTFDAFMVANTLAFICASIATFGLMYSGNSSVSLASRQVHLGTAFYFMRTSITSLTAAFALGAYMVLAPVAHKTAIAICVISSLVLLSTNMEFWLKKVLLAPPLFIRKGLIWTSIFSVRVIVGNMVLEFWPLIFAFGWAAHARDHPVLRTEPPIQPPTPLA